MLSVMQTQIMRTLNANHGVLTRLPDSWMARSDEFYEAIAGLQRRQYVQVVGPSNIHTAIGKDAEELYLLPDGVGIG